jgi:hypothetical protein
MAKKKRQSSAAKKPAGESVKVRQAVQELRDYYQLGLDVLKADRKNPNKRTYSKGVSLEFAERIGKARDYVDKARQFVSKYTEKQFEELCSLRRPDGMPLGRRHVVALLSVEDKRQRTRLQRMAAKEGWGTRRLGDEITAVQGSRSSGGRRPRGPESIVGALVQIVKMSESWGKWCRGFESEQGGDGISVNDLPPSIKTKLMGVSSEMKKLKDTTERQLNKRRALN